LTKPACCDEWSITGLSAFDALERIWPNLCAVMNGQYSFDVLEIIRPRLRAVITGLSAFDVPNKIDQSTCFEEWLDAPRKTDQAFVR
jgi:hypothetical protein